MLPDSRTVELQAPLAEHAAPGFATAGTATPATGDWHILPIHPATPLVCRFCNQSGQLGGGGKWELIRPCPCGAYAHRRCLDIHRAHAVIDNPRGFTHCHTCDFEYRIGKVEIFESAYQRRESVKAQLLRKSLLVALVVQVIIIGLGAIIRMADPNYELVQIFAGFGWDDPRRAHSMDPADHHFKATYYACGVLALFFLIGLTWCVGALIRVCQWCCSGASSTSEDCDTCCRLCCECCAPRRYSYTPYYYRSPAEDCCQVCGECCRHCDCKCDSGPCNDCKGDCDCKGDAGQAVVVVLVLLAVVIVFIGIAQALFALSLAVQKAVQRYTDAKEMRLLATEYVVQDLSQVAPPPAPSAPEAPPVATMEPDLEAAPQPSAPPAIDVGVQRELGVFIADYHRARMASAL